LGKTTANAPLIKKMDRQKTRARKKARGGVRPPSETANNRIAERSPLGGLRLGGGWLATDNADRTRICQNDMDGRTRPHRVVLTMG